MAVALWDSPLTMGTLTHHSARSYYTTFRSNTKYVYRAVSIYSGKFDTLLGGAHDGREETDREPD
jgi:hypothetical protein